MAKCASNAHSLMIKIYSCYIQYIIDAYHNKICYCRSKKKLCPVVNSIKFNTFKIPVMAVHKIIMIINYLSCKITVNHQKTYKCL